MKRLFVYAQLAVAVVGITLISCQKENQDPEPTPEPDPEEYVFVCDHQNLVYVEAVKRTATTRGNIAHYHCNDCNCNFLDANATIQIKNPYLKASNMTIDPEILKKYKDIFQFIPKNQTKAPGSSAKTVFKLLQMVSNFQYRQTTKDFMGQVMSEFKIIENQLSSISSDVKKVRDKNEEILRELKGAPYASKISDILNNEMMVWEISCICFDVIQDYYEDYSNGIITEKQLQDTITLVCMDWDNKRSNSEGKHTYDVTVSLISEFNLVNVNTNWMSYPQLFHEYCDNYNCWDHEGYTDRQQWDLVSEAVLSMGYFMACFYREYVCTYSSPKVHYTDSCLFNEKFNKVDTLVQTDMNNMQLANQAYKRYHNSEYEVLIEPEATIVNSDAIDGHYTDYEFVFTVSGNPDNSNTPHGIEELNNCWNDVHKNGTGYRDGTTLTVEDYNEIWLTNTKLSIYEILDSAGIKNVPSYYLEPMNVNGKSRYGYIRYYSSNLSYTSEKIPTYLHSVDLNCCEYHIRLKTEMTTSGANSEVTYSCNAMKSDCSRSSEYYTLLENYSVGDEIAVVTGEDYRIQGRTTKWKESEYAQVFLRKYTGEIYD